MSCLYQSHLFSHTPFPLASNCCRLSENVTQPSITGEDVSYQRYIERCVEEPDNRITETLSCTGQTYDSITCGNNVSININGGFSDKLGYGAKITLEKWYYGHTRTTEDPGHAFLYSSNDCSGYHSDVIQGMNYLQPEDKQLLTKGSVWVNKYTDYGIVGFDPDGKTTWSWHHHNGKTHHNFGKCISASDL